MCDSIFDNIAFGEIESPLKDVEKPINLKK